MLNTDRNDLTPINEALRHSSLTLTVVSSNMTWRANSWL